MITKYSLKIGFSDKDSSILSLKTEIYDFLFKIKGKEDKMQEQHRIINEILDFIEEYQTKVKDNVIIFKYKSRYSLK